MKKILFILPSLAPGGAERVTSFIAQNLDKNRYYSRLLIVGLETAYIYSTDKVETVFLNKSRLSKAIPLIIKQIRIFKPDIVFSSISYLNVLLAVISPFFKKVHFIGREASVISVMRKYSDFKSRALTRLISIFYVNLSKIVCQSTDMYDDFNKNFNIKANKLVVISNPITFDLKIPRPFFNTDKIKFVTVGRLSKEKGYDRVLRALSKIKNYDYQYTIIGDGVLKDDLLLLANKLGLSAKINHIPFTKNIPNILVSMDVFLQGSYVEGFPNAVLESCTVGTPVIAFNSPGGTREIIENGVNGFVVENETEFEELLQNKHKLTSFDYFLVREYTMNKFSANEILFQYQTLFDSFFETL